MKKLQILILIFVFVLAAGLPSRAQAVSSTPSAKSYFPFLSWLASSEPEGRETGTPGAARAADSIAAEMQRSGLLPWNRSASGNGNLRSGYHQPVTILRSAPRNALLTISSNKKETAISLIRGRDFMSEYAFSSLDLNCPVVFAGYGIHTTLPVWNDYQGLDVSGKAVMIREGYPPAGNAVHPKEAFNALKDRDGFNLSARSREAFSRGALVLLVIPESFDPKAKDQDNEEDPPETFYQDAHYHLPGIITPGQVPVLLLTWSGARSLLKDLPFRKSWRTNGIQHLPRSEATGTNITLKLPVRTDTLVCNNVIGFLPGSDTSQTIVVGAHYDHLGKRGDVIYPGADDNASGVAGLLALASARTAVGIKPPCNIVFASWTAEEKGHHGSKAFVTSFSGPGKIELYINLDMISRSESTDSTRRMLSIGTRTADSTLRENAKKNNSLSEPPFQLDLWDVTGHHGSDYASFVTAGIPILTFNTGLHEDYHTPRDLPEAVDTDKMGRVLRLVNLILKDGCLLKK